MRPDCYFKTSEICLGSSLLDYLNEGIIVLDQEGTVVSVNNWFALQLGYHKTELIGLRHKELFDLLYVQDTLDYEGFQSAFKQALESWESQNLLRHFRDKKGNIIAVQSRLQPLVDEEGRSKGVVAVLKEIEENLLYDIAKNLNTSLALKDVLKITNDEIVNQLGLSSNAIFLIDEGEEEVYLAVCNGWSEEDLLKVRMKLGVGVPGLIAKEGKPIYVENLRTDSRIDPVARSIHPDKSSIGYPLYFKDTLLGVITFDTFGVRSFSQKELRLFKQIVDLVSMVIYNARTYEKVLRQANTDELTGLYNHRHFQEILDVELLRAREHQDIVSLLMVDIDKFKTFNSTYGYTTGDALLKKTASILKTVIGLKGKVARFGGDEFAVLLPGIKVEEATLLAEDIRDKVESSKIDLLAPHFDQKITVSVGVASFPTHALAKEDLITCSDYALDIAKQRNQNKVVVYFSLMDDILNSVQLEEKETILTLKTLMRVINAKDNYTVGHSERVTEYALLIGNELGLEDVELQKIRYGAYLHDIGKIEVSREILNKKSKLTDSEYLQIKRHPENGTDLIRPIKSLEGITPILRHHHERYDGKGYPFGIAGEDIPYLARIVCVADSFDAIISSRPYRSAQTMEFAINELEKCAGTQFDPVVVKAFVKVLKEQYYGFKKPAM